GQAHTVEGLIQDLNGATAASDWSVDTADQLKTLKVLRIALATGALTWLESFHTSDGLAALCSATCKEIAMFPKRSAQNGSPVLQECALSLTAYMDFKEGFKSVLKSSECLQLLVKLLNIPDPKVAQNTCELLTVILYARTGHLQVMRAFTKAVPHGRNRFRSLVAQMASKPTAALMVCGL
ncbi:hypothetical protein SARC_12511, partial [Sphaeroforma arctica JP610]